MFDTKCPNCSKGILSWKQKLTLSSTREVICPECGASLSYPVWTIFLNAGLIGLVIILAGIIRISLGPIPWLLSIVVFLFLLVVPYLLNWIPVVTVQPGEAKGRRRWVIPLGAAVILIGLYFFWLNVR
jgi:hypothetical protein